MLALSSLAQEAPFNFDKFPSDIPLSHSAITTVLQDHQGFLWLGTWSGLLKYDGYNVKQYKQEPGNVNGLESNKITTLFEDSQKQLWVGTRNSGMYLYDRDLDQFIQFKRKSDDMNSLSNNNVWAIFEDKYGYFWVGTENGLNLLNPEQQQFVHFTHQQTDIRSLSHNFVYSICQASDESLWIGTEDGLNRLVRKANGEPDYFVRYNLNPASNAELPAPFSPHNYIYKVKAVADSPQSLWIGTKGGLKKLKFSNENFRKIDLQFFRHNLEDTNSLSHNFVVDMWEGKHNNLWVATFNGLNLLDKRTDRFRRFIADSNQSKQLSNNNIKALFCDRSENLWIGTEGGLHKLNLSAKPFFTIQPEGIGSSGNHVITTIINSTDNNGLWMGTRGGGLHYLAIQKQNISSGKPRQFTLMVQNESETAGFISDIFLDQDGWLWITTLGAGLIKIKESDVLNGDTQIKDLFQYTTGNDLESLSEEHLMAVTGSSSGDIWIGSWDIGLVRYDAKRQEFFKYTATSDFSVNFEAYPMVHLLEVVENGQTILWVGTRGGGLLKLKFNREKNLIELLDQYLYQPDQAGSISNNFINCLFFDSHNRFWVGTENGLNIFHPKTNTFSHFLAKDGLANDIIQSILEDRQGRLWVSTQRGISCLQSDLSLSNPEIKNFDASDGLQDNFFYDDAVCATPLGQLAFGGVNGLSLFFPEDIHPDTIPPKVAITDFRLFNNSIPIGELEDGRVILKKHIGETEYLELSHRDNVISFEFVGIQFGKPQKIQYAHKLDGFDEKWVLTDANQRIAHYTNLPYANFTFLVKAANSDGYWSEPIALKLRVLPPFWLTGRAYFLYAILGLALLYGILKIAKMRAEFNHSLQLERIEREKLEEVNQMKLTFFTNISHELRTPLTLIISPLEQFIKEQKTDKKLHQAYTRMHYNANRLLTMINQLLDIRKSEAGLMKLKVAEGNFIKFTNDIVLSFKGLAKHRQIKLKFFQDLDFIGLWYDRDQMEKVLFNLLSNALKFTNGGDAIEVRIRLAKTADYPVLKPSTIQHPHNDQFCLITISDTGCGIPTDQLAYIFDRFYQVEKSPESARKGGTGIGLALCKSIIEAHHGQIWAESTEDQGATFHCALLLGDKHFKEEEKIAGFKNSEYIGNYVLSDHLEKGLQVSDAPLSITNNGASSDRKHALLIVEDNADIRAYLRENLEENYLIEEAENGVIGLEKALANPPDLILADIAMPHMDGIEMCTKIKSDITTSHVPVILLTARTSLIFKIDGLETGADDYITKPFNMRLLSARIKNLIASRQKLREKFSKNFDFSPSDLVISSLDEQFLSQIKLVVEKHIDDSNFSVEQLAAALIMSRMQLYRKLKALTGKSPNKIIRNIRLKRAAQLLDSKQYNVSEVTYMVGYNDLKSFREQFKKEYGVSPSEYGV
ncbi:MAG: hybrid sensor histidine kinase/response regulator [Saprospiraceae bacterium]|nr:MAG: hybrid sensor histidine kinase/response regulator [Saprospiraceae bacterium]